MSEQVNLWKTEWETYKLVRNSDEPLAEEEFINGLLVNKLVKENEINRDNKIITIANKEISYKLDVPSAEEVVTSDLAPSIVQSEITSSKLKVQVQKPEGLGEDVEYTYTIKKVKRGEEDTIVQTQTAKETSFTFTSLEQHTDYLIEVSTANINGTIYSGSCSGNTYNNLNIYLAEEGIVRTTSNITSLGKGAVFNCYGGPGLVVEIYARIASNLVLLNRWTEEHDSEGDFRFGSSYGMYSIGCPGGYDPYSSSCYIESISVSDITR